MNAAETMLTYEEERGKPVPSKNHGLVQHFLGLALSRYSDRYTVIPELSLDLGGAPLVPDLSIYKKLPIDWLHDEVKMTEPPLTVVEILSPTQGTDELIRKAEQYFDGGVKCCWIVQPSLKVVAVLEPGQEARTYSSGELTDPVTKMTIQLEEIFP